VNVTDLKEKNNRLQVFIDNEYAFSCTMSFAADHRLYIGRLIEKDEYEELFQASQKSILKLKLMEYAIRGKYSPRELTTKLQTYALKKYKSKLDPEFVPRELETLRQQHLYSENSSINNLVQHYVFKSKGRQYILSKLMSKGFNKHDIEKLLLNVQGEDFDKNLLRLLEKKKAGLKETEPFKIKQKLIQYGIGRGYSFSDIQRILRENFRI
jgi:regulatory protein